MHSNTIRDYRYPTTNPYNIKDVTKLADGIAVHIATLVTRNSGSNNQADRKKLN